MFVYIIKCEDNSLYTGVAKDIKKRLKEHYFKQSKCAKYTKSHQMKNLQALWKAKTRSEAYKLEYQIKALNRENKLNLISNQEFFAEFFKDKLNINNYERITNEYFKNYFLEDK